MKCLTLILLLHLFVGSISGFPFRERPLVVDLKKGENQLLVSVARLVDLIEEEDTMVFSERTLAIRFELDVIDKQIMFNDQPIELGVSTFQIEAQIITKPSNINKQIRVMQEKIDSGLVTIQVTANLLAASAIIDNDSIFSRIEIKQDIIEINHKKVMKTNAGHQVIDIFDCGSFIKWSVDPVTGIPPPLPKDDKRKNNNDKIHGFIGGSLCTLFIVILFALFQFIRKDQIIEDEPPSYDEILIQKL